MKSGSLEMLPRRFGFGSCEARSNAKKKYFYVKDARLMN